MREEEEVEEVEDQLDPAELVVEEEVEEQEEPSPP